MFWVFYGFGFPVRDFLRGRYLESGENVSGLLFIGGRIGVCLVVDKLCTKWMQEGETKKAINSSPDSSQA